MGSNYALWKHICRFLTNDGQVSDDQIIGIEKEKKEETAHEFLTKEWTWKYFILLLGGIVVLTMSVVMVNAYRVEASFYLEKI